MHVFLTVVFGILLLNFLVAVAVVLRRAEVGSWLLLLMLSGTTGAALAAIYALLTVDAPARVGDVPLIFTGLAAISAIVAVSVLGSPGAEGDSHDA